jgi:pimeloyl-ACP methyl ester carboxylesterase
MAFDASTRGSPDEEGSRTLSRVWQRVRIVWATVGASATLILLVWSAWAVRPDAAARNALLSDARVSVSSFDDHWVFRPSGPARASGLLFFPGALVDPVAYAPLARAAAEAGHLAILVRVPRRGVLGGAEVPSVIPRARALMKGLPEVGQWLVAGHSRGGEIAARFGRDRSDALGGLLLIATSHPRDFSLADAAFTVTRLSATRDGFASPEKLAANRLNLPAEARLIVVEGGNHSQFGWYGFQPGDGFALIPREEQQRRTLEVLMSCLSEVAAVSAPADAPR